MKVNNRVLLCCLYLLHLGSVAVHGVWLRRPNSTSQYLFGRHQDISWNAAREFCLAQGGDLLSINDVDEKDWILTHYPMDASHYFSDDFSKRYLVIGVHSRHGNWHWVDGSPLDSEIISSSDRQTRSCAYVDLYGSDRLQLKEWDCAVTVTPIVAARFVCERSLEQALSVVRTGVASLPLHVLHVVESETELNRIALNQERRHNQHPPPKHSLLFQ